MSPITRSKECLKSVGEASKFASTAISTPSTLLTAESSPKFAKRPKLVIAKKKVSEAVKKKELLSSITASVLNTTARSILASSVTVKPPTRGAIVEVISKDASSAKANHLCNKELDDEEFRVVLQISRVETRMTEDEKRLLIKSAKSGWIFFWHGVFRDRPGVVGSSGMSIATGSQLE